MTGDRRESSIPLEYAEANRRPTARLSALGTAWYAKNKFWSESSALSRWGLNDWGTAFDRRLEGPDQVRGFRWSFFYPNSGRKNL